MIKHNIITPKPLPKEHHISFQYYDFKFTEGDERVQITYYKGSNYGPGSNMSIGKDEIEHFIEALKASSEVLNKEN